jgi:RNA polymerase sigma-70 factor (ECF subfamily)
VGADLSEYHLEAAIAMVHARAPTAEDTDWATIVELYDTLLVLRPSPVVALNRAIAIAQHAGPQSGLDAIAAIADRDRLDRYPFLFAALGELELRCGRRDVAREHFARAVSVARSPQEREFFRRRVDACE